MRKTRLYVLASFVSLCLGICSPAANATSCEINDTTTQPNISRYGDEIALIPALEKANLSLKGNIFTAWSALQNYKAKAAWNNVGKTDVYAQTRAMFSLTGDISSWLSAEIVFGGYGIWDQHDYTNGVTNLPEDGKVKLFNANVKAKNFIGSGVDLIVGRQFMGTEEDAIFYFGPSRDGRFLETTALDAVRAERAIGPMKIVLAGGEKSFLETGAAQEPPRRENVYAFELHSDKLFATQNVRLFFYERAEQLIPTGGTAYKNDYLACYGFEATGKIPVPVSGFSYKATVALNGGDSQPTTLVGGTKNEGGKYNGYLWRAIGYYDAQPKWGDLSLNGGYVVVSGDGDATDNKVSGFRRIGRDCFYGMAYMTYEIISDGEAEGVENVIIPFAGVKYTPPIFQKKFQIGANYALLKTDKPIAGLDGKGSEANLRLSYALDNNNTFRLIGVKFWPAGIIQKNFGSNTMDQVVFEYELKF